MMKKTIFLLAFIFQIAWINDANAFQLRLEVKIDNKDSVWIGGPIQLNLTIKNTSKKDRILCNPNNNNQIECYIKLKQDSTWIALLNRFTSNPDCDVTSDYSKPITIRQGEKIDFRISLFLPYYDGVISSKMLIPNQIYQLRIIYTNDLKNGCVSSYGFSVEKVKNSKKHLYKDLSFKTCSLDSSMINSLDWISKNAMIDAFTSECFHLSTEEEERKKLKYYLEHFPVSPFYEWAAFQQFKIISESDENEKKYVKEWSKDDLDTLTKYATILAKSHNLRFKEIGLGWLNVIEKW